MTPLSVAYVATAAICLVVGLQHLVMALRVDDRQPQMLFAIAALAVAADAVFERRIYTSASAEEFLAGMPWTALFICTTIVALSWYIALRTGLVRRWLLWAVTLHRGKRPWVLNAEGTIADDVWELYNLKEDYSQSTDLADEYPEKLKELRALFAEEAL